MSLRVREGESLTAELWNALVDALGLGAVAGGKGVRRKIIGGKVILTSTAKGGGGGSSEPTVFQPYRSPWTGSGEAPDSQAFKFRIRLGVLNAQPPDNINAEFTAAGSAQTWCWIKAAFDVSDPAHPALDARILEAGAAVPIETAPETGAPPFSYWPICRVTADADGITEFERVTYRSLNVTPVTVGATCGEVVMQYQWTGVG